MKLIGSTTSPYVRKVRLLLEGRDYEFETLQALSPEGTETLKSYGPLLRVPILITEGKKIFDSTIIAEYLLGKKGVSLTLDEKLNLKLIDELCDSCIELFKQKAWSIDPEWKDKRSLRLLDRLFATLDIFEGSIDQISEMERDWLYCTLDWLTFRDIMDWQSRYTKLESFYLRSHKLKKYESTKIPR
ncbi:glutathione S-transferase N-terminal domain-containing protein [Halobacteriovorax sp.]|uniref:glutathione S-transferase N-terminal domain-containing protein n=1 Tax=Halobacteriovorax sp. TaxID=2020862 RepID=UPI0035677535